LKEKNRRWVIALLVMILIAVVADITIKVYPPAKAKQQSRCLAVPTKFIIEHPDCADKLVQAANLTNMRIVSPKTLESERYEQLMEADNTNGLMEAKYVTHPKVCIKQWQQEVITMEDALHCIDGYMKITNS
jgi:hypothetical protein